MSDKPLTSLPEQLYQDIRKLLQAAQQQVQQSINDTLSPFVANGRS